MRSHDEERWYGLTKRRSNVIPLLLLCFLVHIIFHANIDIAIGGRNIPLVVPVDAHMVEAEYIQRTCPSQGNPGLLTHVVTRVLNIMHVVNAIIGGVLGGSSDEIDNDENSLV